MKDEEAALQVLQSVGISPDLIVNKNHPDIDCGILIHTLIFTDSIKGASELLEIPTSTLEHILERKLKKLFNKTTSCRWNTHLLNLINTRRCSKCSILKPFDQFGFNSGTNLGKNCLCKVCDATKSKGYRNNNLQNCLDRCSAHYSNNKSDYLARNAKRRAAKLQRTPSWADLDKIKEIYRTCPEGYHVDHIVPLQGELVSGLHVEYNLQHLPAGENLAKHNKYNGE